MPAPLVRKARISDVRAIHSLLMRRDHEALVLPRSISQLYSHLRDFFVAEQGGEIVACVALSITWENLAEIRSLVVAPELRNEGMGKTMVEAALSEAVAIGIYTVFTLTEVPGFFAKVGFEQVEKETLNQKIWADCLHCPRFPDHCNEVAMIIRF